ncbi:actin cytoskeleton-regulatory complex protein pan1-like [Drosophila teissieri]|uniref:actin cytoskeleton-regulatory complex protein pan1-like n=1 Tax=Drosophila teissieri TaxID=7243 RepID=UPI001CBA3F4A|nr:actin cytoskeleton-regulatory complex protein pan1-like [Drosophila teissieri]
MGQRVVGPVEWQGRSGGRRMPNPRPTQAPRRGAEDERGKDPEPVVTSDESELEWEEDPKKEMRTWRLKRARSGTDNRILPGTAPVFEEARRNPRGSGGTSAAIANAIVKMRRLEADLVVAMGAPHPERMAAREEYEAAKATRVRMQQRAAMAAMHEVLQRSRTKEEEERRWLQELERAEEEECAAWELVAWHEEGEAGGKGREVPATPRYIHSEEVMKEETPEPSPPPSPIASARIPPTPRPRHWPPSPPPNPVPTARTPTAPPTQPEPQDPVENKDPPTPQARMSHQVREYSEGGRRWQQQVVTWTWPVGPEVPKGEEAPVHGGWAPPTPDTAAELEKGPWVWPSPRDTPRPGLQRQSSAPAVGVLASRPSWVRTASTSEVQRWAPIPEAELPAEIVDEPVIRDAKR